MTAHKKPTRSYTNGVTLSQAFMANFEGKQPEWGPLGEITYRRTYSRQKEDREYEEFWETCKRVVEGVYSIQKWHCDKYKLPWNGKKAQHSAQEMYQRMWEFKFLPPGRGLWAMGTDFMWTHGSAALNNCAFTSTENIGICFSEHFVWAMDMLMHGLGCGFDTKGSGKVTIRRPRTTENVYVVDDSREGWCDLVRTVLDAFVGKDELPLNVDYSKIRPKGSRLKGFGGVASGPRPLEILYERIINILTPLEGEKITSEAIVDLFNVIGACVVSGNIRRSAMIALGDPDDDVFLNLKNPEIEENLPKIGPDGWRWSSNNSVLPSIGDDYAKPAAFTKKNGEIGYAWLENARNYGRMIDGVTDKDKRIMGLNPCGEQFLEDKEICCLVETFPANHETLEDFERTLKYAYLYAKTVTLLPTHSPTTNAVMLRNRRIGTSQSGITQAIAKRGFREHMRWCDEGYKYLTKLDDIYSSWLCIPKSIKISSVKPSGTVSKLVGATSGIHFPIAEYWWKAMRMSDNSPLLKAMKEAGYRVYKGEGINTSIVYIPVKEKNFNRAIKDVSMWEQLELAAQMQAYWSDNGVSATISFKPEEADKIPLALSLYETRLKAVSFLPLISYEDYKKAGYEHVPEQPMTKEEYEEAIKNIKPIKLRSSHEADDLYCDGEACTI